MHTARKVQKLILGRNATRHEYGNNENYAKLGHDVYVAVRFSATAKIYSVSFGQQESYLNVRGDTNLIMRVRDAWASLWRKSTL